MWTVKRTLVVSCDCQTHPTWVYTKTKRVLGASQQQNVPLSWWFKTTRTLGRWRLWWWRGWLDGGVGYDDDGDGEVAVMVYDDGVAAAVAAVVGGKAWRVGCESGVDGRVDQVTATWWPAAAGWPAMGAAGNT
ncbi:hypothetical protein Tco_1310734 [Tanacetum coccineum]